MRRLALLGATGSIGRQALELLERDPELELCGLMSGTQPLDGLSAEYGVEHVQIGGDPGFRVLPPDTGSTFRAPRTLPVLFG